MILLRFCAALSGRACEACWQGPDTVELVPVPAPGRAEGRRSDGDCRRGEGGLSVASRPRARANGAGLEAELAEAVRPDLLPPELRAHLPPRGIINHAEARAVVEALERLVGDADFRAASYLKDWVDMGSLAGFQLG